MRRVGKQGEGGELELQLKQRVQTLTTLVYSLRQDPLPASRVVKTEPSRVYVSIKLLRRQELSLSRDRPRV